MSHFLCAIRCVRVLYFYSLSAILLFDYAIFAEHFLNFFK